MKEIRDSYDEEGLILKKAAQIIRRDMLKKTSGFNGKFDATCQENSFTQSLMSLIRMILEGPTVEHSEKNIARNQARLTIV